MQNLDRAAESPCVHSQCTFDEHVSRESWKNVDRAALSIVDCGLSCESFLLWQPSSDSEVFTMESLAGVLFLACD